MQTVGDVGIWKIVAHVALKFAPVASGTFPTASTLDISRRRSRSDHDGPVRFENLPEPNERPTSTDTLLTSRLVRVRMPIEDNPLD